MATETGELQREALGQQEKISNKKIERFVQNILPGIYERTQESGHFRHMQTHTLISPSEMSDNMGEDAKMYEEFNKKLQNILARAEKSPHLIGESDLRGIHMLFEEYGKGRESGKTHYFVEYLKNKSAMVAAGLELMIEGQMSKERFVQQLQKILWEFTGNISESKKNARTVV